MQILSIRLKNINSLVGSWTIDLTHRKYLEDGLFAITGPTGSGKSTILDAVTLALYGRTPRLQKIAGEENELMSRQCGECEAEVVFRTPQGTFRAFWSQRRARGKSDGKPQAVQRKLSRLPDAPNGEKKEESLLADTLKTVEPKIIEITGMDFDQFTRSVLLAQGHFAEFLQANAADRSELLEKITGTEIYSEISTRVYRRAAEERERFKLIESEAGGMQAVSAEEIERNREEITLLNEECATLEQSLESILASEQDWTENERALRRAGNGRGELIAALDTAERDARRLRTQAAEYEDYRTKNAADGSLVAALAALREKQGQLERARERSRQLERARATCASNREQAEEECAEAGRVCSASKKHAADIQVEIESKEAESRALLDGREPVELRRRIATLTAWKSRAETRIRRDALHVEHDRAQAEERDAAPRIEALEKERADLQNRLDLLIRNRELLIRVQSLSGHREALRNDEPCPLCGATDHPYANHSPESTERTDTEITTARAALAGVEKNLRQKSSEHAALKQRLITQQAECDRLDARLAEPLEGTEADGADAARTPEELESEIKSVEQTLGRIEAVEKSLKALHVRDKEAGKQLREAEQALHRAESRVAELETERKRLDEEHAVCAGEIDAKEMELLRECGAYEPDLCIPTETASRVTFFAEIFSRLASRRERWLKMERDRETVTVELAGKKAAIDEKTRQREILDAEILERTGRRETLRAEIMAKFAPPEQAEPESILETARTATKNTLAERQARLGVLSEKQRYFEEQRGRAKELADRLERQTEIVEGWNCLDELIGSAGGQKYRTFVQDLAFDLLLDRANVQLAKLTNRYVLERTGGPKEELRLRVIDNHQGGLVRGTENLSGGETFLVSLALALGLSDLASRNVPVDSLFLDEGFGTLDAETLDTAMRMLVELRRQGRVIGIISHVPVLRERIATRIKVIRQPGGRSVLEGPGVSNT